MIVYRLTTKSRPAVLPARFAAKCTPSASGCWLWRGHLTYGYGRYYSNGKFLRAHRFAYEVLVGPIPDGLELDHLCRVRHCVNPAHVEPVTHRENILRGVGLPAVNAAKTECDRGHPFTEANTIRYRDGRRECRACKVTANAEYRARRRAA